MPRVGLSVSVIVGLPVIWKLPVIGGLELEVVTVAVIVTLCPRVIFGGLAERAAVVG